jgi:energy-coupling factor transporter ATP-binding protein EcfA2
MLTRLIVQRFKSLELVDVELGQMNVFIGPNGSGKSSLLEALGFLSAAADGKLDDQSLLRRGVRPSVASSIATSLREYPAPLATKIVGHFSAPDGSIEHGIRTSEDSTVSDLQWIEERKLHDLQGDLRYHAATVVGIPMGAMTLREAPVAAPWAIPPDSVIEHARVLADYGIFTPTTPALRGTVTDITQREPVGLAGGQLAEAVGQLLKPRSRKFGRMPLDDLLTLLDWVEDIAVAPPSRELAPASVPTTRQIIRFTDRWMRDSRNQLSAYDASEGALYVLFAMVLALHPGSPRLFAVEGLDQNMHPRLARATVRLFCEQALQSSPSMQVLLATHNSLSLDALDLRDDRIRLFTVERSRGGATRIDRVQVSEEVLQAVKNGLSLSNLWVMGRLGGAPDLF